MEGEAVGRTRPHLALFLPSPTALVLSLHHRTNHTFGLTVRSLGRGVNPRPRGDKVWAMVGGNRAGGWIPSWGLLGPSLGDTVTPREG